VVFLDKLSQYYLFKTVPAPRRYKLRKELLTGHGVPILDYQLTVPVYFIVTLGVCLFAYVRGYNVNDLTRPQLQIV
jgi:hypothetical protein